MPRSTARGARKARWRPAEAIPVTCAACGHPFGYLQPAVEGQIEWEGAQNATDAAGWDATWTASAVPPPPVVRDMIDHSRRRRRCRCGAAPVYRQATLAARYQAARHAGTRHVSL